MILLPPLERSDIRRTWELLRFVGEQDEKGKYNLQQQLSHSKWIRQLYTWIYDGKDDKNFSLSESCSIDALKLQFEEMNETIVTLLNVSEYELEKYFKESSILMEEPVQTQKEKYQELANKLAVAKLNYYITRVRYALKFAVAEIKSDSKKDQDSRNKINALDALLEKLIIKGEETLTPESLFDHLSTAYFLCKSAFPTLKHCKSLSDDLEIELGIIRDVLKEKINTQLEEIESLLAASEQSAPGISGFTPYDDKFKQLLDKANHKYGQTVDKRATKIKPVSCPELYTKKKAAYSFFKAAEAKNPFPIEAEDPIEGASSLDPAKIGSLARAHFIFKQLKHYRKEVINPRRAIGLGEGKFEDCYAPVKKDAREQIKGAMDRHFTDAVSKQTRS